MGTVDSLLQEIQNAVRCHYLSDLHSHEITFGFWAEYQIMRISNSRYSLNEWNKAASYILKVPCGFQSIEEAKLRILCKV